MQKTRITQRSRQKKRKSGEKQNENKTAQAKANPEQNEIKTHAKRRVGSVVRTSKERDMETSPGCVDRV